ncbi:hypothetical protein ABIE65_002010 [Constrictibacter sp. MBR-5]|jgi:hypothetical protein|uniref:hypothetical protein n=1 Tax=Constrictibacter sp. MBR-5 TaxID=3156467 RepID=UPI0033945C18
MPLTNAERQARHRMRDALGLVCIRIEVDEFALADFLVSTGRLTEAEVLRPALVAQAVADLVAQAIRHEK